MKLLKLKYKPSYEGDWELENLTLNSKINLLVGQNAVGKSKTLSRISLLSYLLTGFDTEENIPIGKWECLFQKTPSETLLYSCEIIADPYENEDLTIPIEHRIGVSWFIEEKLFLNEQLLLSREGENAKIYSFVTNKFSDISPPYNQLVIQVRRDRIEYPFFEDLVRWSKGFRLFEFSNVHPLLNKQIEYNDVGKLLNKLPEASKVSIQQNLIKIGYKIDKIQVNKTWNGEHYVTIKEQGVGVDIYESHLSQGLMRALVLLVFIEYSIYFNNVSTIAIDDLSEGLDYERATKLGKLLVEKLENSNIQFIATSNDSFLMDVVPIKYWNILQRDGNTVRALNYHNSKEQFDEFKLSGLSNFYLFSSDFLTQKQD
jgi:AAA15 family ATPase/GTPase